MSASHSHMEKQSTYTSITSLQSYTLDYLKKKLYFIN